MMLRGQEYLHDVFRQVLALLDKVWYGSASASCQTVSHKKGGCISRFDGCTAATTKTCLSSFSAPSFQFVY
jgi:hypothetical protein